MQLKTRALGALAGLVSVFALTAGAIAADRAYTEEVIIQVSSIRTEPGMYDEYMKYLAGPYKQFMEEQKKAGIILDYAVYSVVPRVPSDPDLYLTTTLKDMAALECVDGRSDPIAEKIFGSMQQQNAAGVERGKMRSLIGEELIRQLVLK